MFLGRFLWLALLEDGARRDLQLRPGRHAWVHVARGSDGRDGTTLSEGDGASVSGSGSLALTGRPAAEVLVFDLA